MRYVYLIALLVLLHGIVACGQAQEKVSKPVVNASSYSTPDYADTSTFREEEIQVVSSGITLPGTLSMPYGNGPFPAVILVHGSGPHDRDETIYVNKPFRDLAWGLASKGIAVLRYDKRSKVAPMSFAKKVFTVKEEVTDDAVEALKFLRTKPNVDAAATFVLGHSLGATLAPRIAEEDGKVRGIIVMAGTARPFEEIISEQAAYLVTTDTSAAMQLQKTMLDSMAAKVRRLTSKDSLNPASVGGAPAAYFLDFRQENAPARAARLGKPALVLQGKRDYQVTQTDFALWEKALKGTPIATLKSYESLNHIFMTGIGPSTPKEYMEANHIPFYVIEDIAAWITASSH